MEERATIFRPEAVENRAQLQAPGDIVRIGAGWTTWAFWALLSVVILVLVLAGSQIEIDRYALGVTATDRSGRVFILVPATYASDVEVGDPIDLGPSEATVVSIERELLSPAEVESLYGASVSVPSLVLVSSAVGEEASAARVLVGSEPVLVALVPGLKALFGDGDG